MKLQMQTTIGVINVVVIMTNYYRHNVIVHSAEARFQEDALSLLDKSSGEVIPEPTMPDVFRQVYSWLSEQFEDFEVYEMKVIRAEIPNAMREIKFL